MSALPHAQPTTRLPALADGHCYSAGGVTLNDAICAAKIERLFA